MIRFLLDTGSAGDYIHRRRNVFERASTEIRTGNRVGIAVPVLAELWFGVENSVTKDRNSERLRRILPDLIIWPLTEKAAEEYGRLAAELRRMGRPIGQIDLLIAAIAITLGKTVVVSADRDLSSVPGLVVENWSSP